MTSRRPTWICRLFGCKFKITDWGSPTWQATDYCTRCGVRHG